MTTFDERDFRDALSHFATGVVVITADVGGSRLGATVSSFNSVSLTPPLVLFSLVRSAYGLAQWQAAAHYGISILHENQDAISNRFARSGADKWQDIGDMRMQNGAPLLPSWLAYFECEPYARYDGGDHEIFVGRVTRFERRAPPTRPLIFYNGKYRSLNSEEAVTTPPDANIWLHGW